jgi:hypothetical protein
MEICCIFAYLAIVAQQRVYMPQYEANNTYSHMKQRSVNAVAMWQVTAEAFWMVTNFPSCAWNSTKDIEKENTGRNNYNSVK